MKCERCGADLPENSIRCIYCGETLQMVPDYNPLGDVIEDEVRSAITTDPLDMNVVHANNRNRNTARMNNKNVSRNTRAMKQNTAQMLREEHGRNEHTREERGKEEALKASKEKEARRKREQAKRREIEKRKAQKKKQRDIVIGALVGIVVLIILGIYLGYSNSYQGQIAKGWKASDKGEIYSAISYFEKAISKKPANAEAYIALSEIYEADGDLGTAETILTDALDLNPDNLELSQALIQFYVSNDEMEKINEYMNSLTNQTMIDALKNYSSAVPEFSLEEGTYDDVQELSILSNEETIYYTTDGTEATQDSERYTTAIQIGEGTTIVRAISVNSEGVPSYEVQAEYTVELPMETAPIVTPSTGQYKEQMQISVTVPTGYTAYYTLDNTTPTTESQVYTGPIDMPEGNTIFTAVLVNSSGKYSDTTKRNYYLVLEEEDTEEEIE